MGHIPEDENVDEFMNASAEEWSKPEETSSEPEPEYEHDRWGSPIPEEATIRNKKRVDSEPSGGPSSYFEPPKKKGGSKWWIIVIIVLIVLCICVCIGGIVGLGWLGIDAFRNMPLEFNTW